MKWAFWWIVEHACCTSWIVGFLQPLKIDFNIFSKSWLIASIDQRVTSPTSLTGFIFCSRMSHPSYSSALALRQYLAAQLGAHAFTDFECAIPFQDGVYGVVACGHHPSIVVIYTSAVHCPQRYEPLEQTSLGTTESDFSSFICIQHFWTRAIISRQFFT